MTTPLIVLCILLTPLLAAWVIGGRESIATGGVLGIAIAFAFFGVGHFAQNKEMVAMLPEFVPLRTELVLTTGVLEFAIAAGLLLRGTRRVAGYAAIAALVGFFPANIYAAINHTGMGGHAWGPVYLLIRAPLQMLLIGWAWGFAVRQVGVRHRPMIVKTLHGGTSDEADLHG